MACHFIRQEGSEKTLPSLSSVDRKLMPAHGPPEDETLVFQLIEVWLQSWQSMIAAIERFPVAASLICSLHHFIIGRRRSM